VIVKADRAVPVPDATTSELAAAVLLQGMTAHYLATSTYPIRRGDAVLVHAAAGGVGLLLTQIVKLRGGRVLATTSTPEKAELARGAGADHVVGYDGFGAAAQEFSAGSGMAVVYDGIGQATFDESLGSLRPRGFMVLYGAASGQVPPVDPQRLNSGGSLYLTRPTLAHYTADRDELRWRAAEVLGAIAGGHLRVSIGGRYPLDDAQQAYRDLEGRGTTGKLLIVP
jgi:NADPH:quinone reductase